MLHRIYCWFRRVVLRRPCKPPSGPREWFGEESDPEVEHPGSQEVNWHDLQRK